MVVPYLTSDINTTTIWVDEAMTDRVFIRLPRFQRWERLVLQAHSIYMKERYVDDVYQEYSSSSEVFVKVRGGMRHSINVGLKFEVLFRRALHTTEVTRSITCKSSTNHQHQNRKVSKRAKKPMISSLKQNLGSGRF